MKTNSLLRVAIALSLLAALSACILVPVGGDDHGHRSGDYHEGHDHDHD